ncbi:hypothetical protein PMAYCL1PPCAC_09323, partial [Pristionchus mayeri]
DLRGAFDCFIELSFLLIGNRYMVLMHERIHRCDDLVSCEQIASGIAKDLFSGRIQFPLVVMDHTLKEFICS